MTLSKAETSKLTLGHCLRASSTFPHSPVGHIQRFEKATSDEISKERLRLSACCAISYDNSLAAGFEG